MAIYSLQAGRTRTTQAKLRAAHHPSPSRPSPGETANSAQSLDPRRWPLGDAGIAPKPSPVLAGRVAAAFDGSTYSIGKTIGVVVVRDGNVVAERYDKDWGPLVPNRTWSVAKSIAGTLIGVAKVDAPAPLGAAAG